VSRKGAYIPERGDAVWITLDPQAGHEQAGRRPALVLSPSAYNGRVGLALFCPITSQVKGYPFEVLLPAGSPVSGVVGADQVKSLDWRARKAVRIGPVSEDVVSQVMHRLRTLLPGVGQRSRSAADRRKLPNSEG
jgi:mRNA interferase MazF